MHCISVPVRRPHAIPTHCCPVQGVPPALIAGDDPKQGSTGPGCEQRESIWSMLEAHGYTYSLPSLETRKKKIAGNAVGMDAQVAYPGLEDQGGLSGLDGGALAGGGPGREALLQALARLALRVGRQVVLGGLRRHGRQPAQAACSAQAAKGA